MLDALLDRFRAGDRLALARLVSFLARGRFLEEIMAGTPDRPRPARVVAVTGSAGVGKSTLVGKLIEVLRRQERTVAVLACDPQSPLTGGALLGDRFRMPSRPDDPGVFIRSLAAPGGKGAVAEHIQPILHLLEGFGFDVIILETVGAGQGDTVVRDLADVVVLLLQPETGDDLQWEKAGVLEVADLVVVHKADMPGADRVIAQVKGAMGLADGPAAPVLRVSSKTGDGLEELARALWELPARRHENAARAGELLRLAQEAMRARFARLVAADDAALGQLLHQWQAHSLPTTQAVAGLLRLLGEPSRSGNGTAG